MIHPKIATWLFCSILLINLIVLYSTIAQYNSEYLVFEKALLDHPEKFDYIYDLLIKFENYRRNHNILFENIFIEAIFNEINGEPTSSMIQ